MNAIKSSELVLAPDGSLYHIRLTNEHVADNVILVGDPARVKKVATYFDKIEFETENREIKSCTGVFSGKRITVLSTGMGTDNIDIVVNELDAAVNIDLQTRQPKSTHRQLNLVRLGTCGALQEDIPVESMVASEFALGIDGLLHFYKFDEALFREDITTAFVEHTQWNEKLPYPYTVAASAELLNKVAFDIKKGITATAPGFYAPQGRELRLQTNLPSINEHLTNFSYKGHRIVNFEMESSALFGLSKLLGHNAVTICTVIANRLRGEFASDYENAVEKMIKQCLERI